jgi:(p)ppGpp synthase/HD superfamily hydrolase
MSDLDKAIFIAVKAHHGQKDRQGQPYILHPLRVMMAVRTAEEKTVAALHDVVEDTDLTLEDLKNEGFSDEIVQAVDCLTKRDGEPYEAHVERARHNRLALPIKLADLEDNMDPRRIVVFSDEDKKRMARYHRTWKALRDKQDG